MRSGDQKELAQIRDYWKELAKKHGLKGLYLISSRRVFGEPYLFDNVFLYEPNTTGFGKRNSIEVRLQKYLGFKPKTDHGVRRRLDYVKFWSALLQNARKALNGKMFLGGLVGFDDAPRRGERALVIENGTPELFRGFFRELYRMSCENDRELLFLTAWNEWGEGAYLEPDETDGFRYLEAVRDVKRELQSAWEQENGAIA